LTHRFHHIEEDNVNRAVVAWHRFLRTLHEEYNITPICVFDGSGRVPEKAREHQKRVETRRRLKARGELEKSRGDRLRELVAAFKVVKTLPPDEASRVIELARDPFAASKPATEPSTTGIENFRATAPRSIGKLTKPALIKCHKNQKSRFRKSKI
jgi:hypothetical protein